MKKINKAALLTVLILVLTVFASTASASHFPRKHNRGLHARNLPRHGKVLFVMGQDGDTLTNLKNEVLEVDPEFPAPGGITLYTNLSSAALSGLWTPVDFRIGRSFWEEHLNDFDGAFEVGLEFVDYADLCNPWPLQAVSGTHPDAELVAEYQTYLDQLILYLKKTRRPVYLRIGYGFDGPWNCYDPAEFVTAFQYIANRIDRLRARNIATVWHTAAWAEDITDPDRVQFNPSTPGHWDLWYPGDAYVDWFGITTFAGENFDDYQWAFAADDFVGRPPREIQDEFLDLARERKKPVMVAEAAPQGFDLGELTASCIFASGEPYNNKVSVSAEEIWDSWFEDMFDWVEENRDIVRAFSYINADWDSQGNWSCTVDGCNGGYWDDSRIQANPYIYEQFKARISERSVYVQRPRPVRDFNAPDFSWGRGLYEAEFGRAPIGWNEYVPTGAFPLPGPNASGNRDVMLLNWHGGDDPSIVVDKVRRSNQVVVTYAATNEGSFSLLLNGEVVAVQPFEITGSEDVYTQAVFDG